MKRMTREKILAQEVGILDNNSEWLGIPKKLLMECAGYSFAMEIIKKYDLKENSKVVFFCGTGNNGGDGFVVARHLSSFGIKSHIILLGSPEKIGTEEAKLNWNILSNSLIYNAKIKIAKDSTDVVEMGIVLDSEKHDLIVDAMLGTGIKGKLREPVATAVEFINEAREHQNIPVVSVDVPSGLDPDTGEVGDNAVKADLVITFHQNKKGMDIENEYMGEILVKTIGIPQEAQLFVGRGDFLPTLTSRRKDFHKGQFGRMLVLGGSKNYTGAPSFSSLAGINFGLDLVITFTPQVVGDVIRSYSPNMIVRSQPGDWLNNDSWEEISWLVDWSNAILIGPGMGEEEETEELLVALLKKFREEKKRFVLDADALKLVKNHHDLLRGQQCILTPHEGELKIMTGIELSSFDNLDARIKSVLDISSKLDCTLLVKGPYDYISDGKNLKINRTGCPEMAVGGTGDVLAGLCTAFLATESDPFPSACSAAFLNGYIGEFCKEKLGSRFNALDMIDNINEGIEKLINFKV
jgi:ADP-dependent NAD(P)H-hydrate dehydratase / NAD(P)H-hydrate epimerase